jgi:antitoxin (DNA-binding transcriptional repressor) of toxin-antitoxin stability system
MMIQANISEVKNRLSYYLKLVKGGEQVVILDRKTALARIVHVASAVGSDQNPSSWIEEARDLGLVTPPLKGAVDPKILEKDLISDIQEGKESGVLQALIDEREDAR